MAKWHSTTFENLGPTEVAELLRALAAFPEKSSFFLVPTIVQFVAIWS